MATANRRTVAQLIDMLQQMSQDAIVIADGCGGCAHYVLGAHNDIADRDRMTDRPEVWLIHEDSSL